MSIHKASCLTCLTVRLHCSICMLIHSHLFRLSARLVSAVLLLVLAAPSYHGVLSSPAHRKLIAGQKPCRPVTGTCLACVKATALSHKSG